MSHLHDHQPSGQFLFEENYKDIMAAINPNDLPYRNYEPLLKAVQYQGYKGSVLKFFVQSKLNGWNTYISFKEWYEQMEDSSLTSVDAARLLLYGGNIRCHCNCPAYRFWGMQYIDTQLGMAIVPETRAPNIRNPHLKGIVCKHLQKSFRVLPFHLGDMASAIKAQRSKNDIHYIPVEYGPS